MRFRFLQIHADVCYSPHLFFFFFSVIDILVGMKWYLLLALIYVPPTAYDVELPFTCWLAICTPLGGMTVQ